MAEKAILIVDDEAIVRESIRDWLQDAGYPVVTAESGEQALELISKQDFSVLVLDLRLPGITGINVLKEVKAQRPWIKTLIVTAYPTAETISEARKLGAIDYLIKPVAPDELERRIRETIGAIRAEPTVFKPSARPEIRAGGKKHVFLPQDKLKPMVQGLMQEYRVIGVTAKQGKFVYDTITDPDKLVLDFDVTYLPPTKHLLPARDVLLKFKIGAEPETKLSPETAPTVLFGVHPYDLRAIELLDDAFMLGNSDPNYSARRRNMVIIGVDCLYPSPKSFASSMGTNVTETGFDLLLTDVGTGYVVTVGSTKGENILDEYAETREPSSDEIARQKYLRDDASGRFKLFLDTPRERLPKLLEEAWDDPYWETKSKGCLKCGSCVMVCPTCFCFDVQDEVSLDLKEGERFRQWDGCVLIDFARVASGENFRHDKASRFRHRIYRKGKYVMEKYGRFGCVGCGRCTSSCLPDIASPLEAFNAVAQSARIKESVRFLTEAPPEAELYQPRPSELLKVLDLTPSEKAFEFRFKDGKPLGHKPGQFVEMSLLGYGEAPFGVATSPTRGDTFQLAIRNVGSLTDVVHGLKPGAVIGIRGPYGNGFPIESLEGKDVLIIAGGTGLFPTRSLVQYIEDKRKSFGRVILLFGSRSPADRLFTADLAAWARSKDIEFMETVDKGDETWRGNVGVITTLIPRVQFDPRKTRVVVVGPPIMYRFVIAELKKRDMADENIILSLERRMKCGVGKCGHCQINGIYVCQNGPVFTLAQLRNLREAI